MRRSRTYRAKAVKDVDWKERDAKRKGRDS